MSRLDAHVATVQRKLALGIFVEWLAMTSFVAAVFWLLTILLERLTHVAVPASVLWGTIALAITVAGVMAIIQCPDNKAAAVAIDDRLALKEKFSTALCVRNMADPFARAVVLDAEQTADKVRLAGKFPLQFPRMAYGTLIAAILALLVWGLMPDSFDLFGRKARAEARREQERQIASAREQIKEAIKQVEALQLAKVNNEQIRLAKLDLQDLLNKKIDSPEAAARRRMEAMQKVDDALKKQIAESKQFAQAQKSAADFRSMTPPVDQKGPVADAHRDIQQGDFKKAVEDIQKAVDKFKDMSESEKQQAMKQMQNLAQELQAMAENKRGEQQLKNDMQQLGVKPEQIKQMQQLMQQAAIGDKQAQQQLQKLQQQAAQNMNQQQKQQMQQAMQKGQQNANQQAMAQQMAQAAQQMAQAMQAQQANGQQQGNGQGQNGMADAQAQMQQLLGQMQAMQADAQVVEAAQKALEDLMAAAGNCAGNGGQGGNPKWGKNMGEWAAGDPNGKWGAGQGGPGQAAGGGIGKQAAPAGFKTELSPSKYDPKGQHLASTLVKDRSVRGEQKLELQQMIQAGQADEGDEVDNNSIDGRSREVKRKYFKVMEGEVK